MDSTNLTTRMERAKMKDFQKRPSRITQKRSIREQNSQVLKIASRGVFESEWYESLGPVSACTDVDESGVNAKSSDIGVEGSHDKDVANSTAQKANGCGVLEKNLVYSPTSPARITSKNESDNEPRTPTRGPQEQDLERPKRNASADNEGGGLIRRISDRTGPLRLVHSMVGRMSRRGGKRVPVDAGTGETSNGNGSGTRSQVGLGLRSPDGKDRMHLWRSMRG